MTHSLNTAPLPWQHSESEHLVIDLNAVAKNEHDAMAPRVEVRRVQV